MEATVFPELLARNLRMLRKRQGFTQEELEFASGVHRTVISKIERSAQGSTYADTIFRLAAGLGVSPAEFFVDEEAEAAKPTDAAEEAVPQS